MLDFNKAHSNSANAAKRIKARQMTKAQLISCEGKVSFVTFTAASKVAKQRRREVKVKRNAYLCFYCRHYHIG